MKVRKQIEQHAKEEDKEILLWLLSKYPMRSQFFFVARCSHKRYGKLSYEVHLIWEPTEEGRILYNHAHKDKS